MKVRTTNTQPKLYDIQCNECGNIVEILDIHKEQYTYECSKCKCNTTHTIVVNGGTGYRWRWADLGGRPEVKIGDPW